MRLAEPDALDDFLAAGIPHGEAAAFIAAGHELGTAWLKCQPDQTQAIVGKCLLLGTAGRIPQTHGAIKAAASQRFAIW